MPAAATARLNLRISQEALETIRAAAAAQQQDVTSFVLGAAMDRAHSAVRDWHLTRLTLAEAQRLEDHLDADPTPDPHLIRLLRDAEAHRLAPRTYRIDEPGASEDDSQP